MLHLQIIIGAYHALKLINQSYLINYSKNRLSLMDGVTRLIISKLTDRIS